MLFASASGRSNSAGSEAGALKLTQRNQCDGADQPTASIQQGETFIAIAMQDVKQQPAYEEAAMPVENENIDKIQNSVVSKGGVKNHRK